MGKKIRGSFIKSSSSTIIIFEIKEIKEIIKIKASSFIDENGHVTLESISNNREWFYGKTIEEIGNILINHDYTFYERESINKDEGSKARILVITNTTKNRNISQVQVSPGSSRHGDVPYVKISTMDIGKIKIIDSTDTKYKTDGSEKAKLLYRREK